jgi:hypothetical protein
MMKRAFAIAVLMGFLSPALAVSVQSWSASGDDEFARGTLDGTALDEEGRVRLALVSRTIWGPAEGIVWGVQPAGEDGAFVALSGPGRVQRVREGEEPELWFVTGEESLVTALAADGRGGVYFGVTPEGKLLHAKSVDEVTTVAATSAVFIWALAVQRDGTVWVGTGVPGQLQRVGPDGEVEVVFDADDDPIRSIALLPGGGALVGTGARGRVIRIDAHGNRFVLLDADEEEIVGLHVGEDGTVFALAAQGSKQIRGRATREPGQPADQTVRVTAKAPPSKEQPENEQEAREDERVPPTRPPADRRPTFQSSHGGALYRLELDGNIRKIWSTPKEFPFALTATEGGDLIVSTGDEGGLYLLDPGGRASRLLRIASSQASAIAGGSGGTIVVGGTSDARVELLGPGPRQTGDYLSPAVDAGSVAEWGRLRWDVELPEGTEIEIDARSGNTDRPDDTWSDWRPAGDVSAVQTVETDLPAARYFQARLRLSARNGQSPLLRRLDVHYMPRNRPPKVTLLSVEPSGVVWMPSPTQSSSRSGPVVANDPVTRQMTKKILNSRRRPPAIRRGFEAGARTINWKADDPDHDRLEYNLEIRQEGGDHWFPLAADLAEEYFSWDARAMPDGYYRVRLTADDAPDNAEGSEQWDREISDAFQIDNSRPSVEELEVRRDGRQLRVRFAARDAGGSIAAVEVALNGGNLQPLEPVDGVADSEEELYELLVDVDRGATPTLTVRATDTAGNIGGNLWLLE